MSEEAKAEEDRKIQRSATLSKALVDRARNAVFWTRMIQGEPGSFSELVERGMRDQVERLEREYNDGEPFEHGELRPGPAPGVMERVAEMRRARAAQESAEGTVADSGESSR